MLQAQKIEVNTVHEMGWQEAEELEPCWEMCIYSCEERRRHASKTMFDDRSKL